VVEHVREAVERVVGLGPGRREDAEHLPGGHRRVVDQEAAVVPGQDGTREGRAEGEGDGPGQEGGGEGPVAHGPSVADHTKVSRVLFSATVKSVQERYAPGNQCFGCGPANDKGLRIRSFEEGDELVAEFRPEPHHLAFPGVLNGGIVGALLDCHSNWTAALHLMKKAGLGAPPCTVTADYAIKLKRPTPMDAVVKLRARIVSSTDDRAVVEATMEAGGKTTATCRGEFVAVGEGHPAFHRW
jgi:acyl-coenzyme A thioesterase PaaI-like protein